ncbi:hypothetical protein AALP_AA3G079900 [Arabis alpina]|uniref:Uncharacterized protein n=1 Tax=Arabis alpina TaxID=50452 RepID=A0A087H7T1_ARAAL|nr:hypothetical protein AALP_AA3G079900 [Arabis alpina]
MSYLTKKPHEPSITFDFTSSSSKRIKTKQASMLSSKTTSINPHRGQDTSNIRP